MSGNQRLEKRQNGACSTVLDASRVHSASKLALTEMLTGRWRESCVATLTDPALDNKELQGFAAIGWAELLSVRWKRRLPKWHY
jgi:hypothetical protein